MALKQAFENMCWHDNHVHAFAIEEGDDGTGELILDIDYIEQWIQENNAFAFMIAPSTLIFHKAFNLALTINFAQPSMAVAPFAIHHIHRHPLVYPSGYRSFKWCIELNYPVGEITFESPGFSQYAKTKAIKSKNQWLSAESRPKEPLNRFCHPTYPNMENLAIRC